MITFLIFALSSNFLAIIIPAIRLNIVLTFASAVLSLMFVVVSIQYIKKVKAEKCNCSQNLTREIMYYYSWIMLVLFILSLTLSFFLAYRLYSLQNKSQFRTIQMSKK
jgi:choline-glycine betaine transporter